MYQTQANGRHYELGTSGFLYRSSKLMYDHDTQSLWSTLQGKPVVGILVDKGIKLSRRHVVTTTWGEWKRRHPETTVLSLDTGHRRDYGEGVAYRDYFATDRLMFAVPGSDKRLLNKDQVLALRKGDNQLAIATKYLDDHPVYHDRIGTQAIVVLTDRSGANRVYAATDVEFDSWDQIQTAVDTSGKKWTMNEESLTDSQGKVLIRVPAHRAFWFGWHAQFPDTRLVK